MKRTRKNTPPIDPTIIQAEDLPSTLDLAPYIDATVSSSNRALAVLILIITACILVFSAFWNSRPENWMGSRIGQVHDAIYWWDVEHSNEKPAALTYNSDDERLARGRAYVQNRQITSRTQLEERWKKLMDLQTEQVLLFRVPFFGMAFDINDLGVLAGFSFVVLLVGFRFYLLRELFNVSLTFNVAREINQLRVCYQRLGMHQVLHVPKMMQPPDQGKDPLRDLSDNLPKILFFLPFVLMSLVFIVDLRTVDIGVSLSPIGTTLLIGMDLFFVIYIGILTVSCLAVARKISGIWQETGMEIAKARDGVRSASSSPEK